MAEDEEVDQTVVYEPDTKPGTSNMLEDVGSGEKQCRPRIDQLAIPSRRLILSLYQDHAHHLSKDRLEKIRQLLQELYAMTPEETEKYFADMKRKEKEVSKTKDFKSLLKRIAKKKKREKQYNDAYQFIRELLIKGMKYAIKNPMPPLVSIRLRHLSNIILEQICDLRNINVPNRANSQNLDRNEQILISIADWMAVAIEHVYYDVQLKKNVELEKIEGEEEIKRREREMQKMKISEKSNEEKMEKEDEQGILSEELLLDGME